MRQAQTNPFHNPFKNRFNDPVTRRDDEMQANAYMVWLRERNQGASGKQSTLKATHSATICDKRTPSGSASSVSRYGGRVFAGVFALFLVLMVSAAVLLKAF
jgi:hypothetical protein